MVQANVVCGEVANQFSALQQHATDPFLVSHARACVYVRVCLCGGGIKARGLALPPPNALLVCCPHTHTHKAFPAYIPMHTVHVNISLPAHHTLMTLPMHTTH